MNLAEITERQSRVVANIESLYPTMRSPKQPRPAGRPRRVDPGELAKVWTRFVERWERGDWKLPRAESVHGLCRFSSVGGCLDPVFEGVVDMWFDPNATPHHGNIVIANLDPRALARIYECMAQNDAAIQAYGAQPVEPVIKLFATVGGQHWLVQRHGAVQLAGGRVLGVLKHVGPPPAHRIEWTNPAGALFDVIEVWASEDDQWSNAEKIAETKANTYTVPLAAGEQRWFWVRAKRANGRRSKRNPDSDTSTVTATSGNASEGFVHMASQYVDEQSGTLPQTASLTFTTDGLVQDSTGATLGKWWTNAPEAGVGDDYEIRLSAVIAGSFDNLAASVGTWVDLSTDRTWGNIRTAMEGSGTDNASGTFQIRPKNGTTILAESTGTVAAGDS